MRGRTLIAEHPESRHRYLTAIAFTAGPLTEGLDIKAYGVLEGWLIGNREVDKALRKTPAPRVGRRGRLQCPPCRRAKKGRQVRHCK